MANQKISQLTALTGADSTGSDLVPVVDVSPSATTKKMTRAEFFRNTPNIGVGVSTPTSGVHIANTSSSKLQLQSTSGVGGGFIAWHDDLGVRHTYIGTVNNLTDDLVIWQESNSTIRFGTDAVERMRIDSAGNVGIGTTTPGSALDVDGQISGKFTDVGTNTAAQALATNHVSQVTISANATLTTTVPPAGALATVIIITSGATSRTVTFGTGFASTGTLATGVTTARRFVVSFVSDGTRLLETARTTAITV